MTSLYESMGHSHSNHHGNCVLSQQRGSLELVKTAALSQEPEVFIIPKHSAPLIPFPVLGARPPSSNANGGGGENSEALALVSYHCSKINGEVEVGKLHRQKQGRQALGKLS